MTSSVDLDGFNEHYLRELDYLRRQGKEYAQRHSKIAARLDLQEGAPQDPHVERLIESFAFLTARIQRKLDDEYEELVDGLLGVLYPHLAAPIPAMAVVEAELDLEQSVPARGKVIPAATTFRSRSVRGEPLRFRSSAPAVLWPIEITTARLEAPTEELRQRHPRARKVLRLALSARGEHPFGVLEISKLQLFLKGESALAWELHETILLGLLDAELVLPSADGRKPLASLSLGRGAVRPWGLDDEQALLPGPRRSFASYRLLQEYFAFPPRFRLLEIAGLDVLRGHKSARLDLVFVLDRGLPHPEERLDAQHFSFACLPLVNLFEHTADPIPLQPLTTEYDLVLDRNRMQDLEVHSVPEEGVLGTSSLRGDKTVYAPLFSLRHLPRSSEPPIFWHLRRRAARAVGDQGTDVSLVFVDPSLQRRTPADEKLEVRALCSNRDLPHALGGWGQEDDFQVEQVTGLRAVRCIEGPTPTRRMELSGSAHWRLLAQLSLSHLSLVREGEGKEALQALLHVHDHGGQGRDEIDAIQDVRSETVVRRVRGELGSGLCRGLRTTLVLERSGFVGGSALAFAAVLERFLARAAAIHSFSELALEMAPDSETVYTWPPRAGEKVLL